MDFETLFYFLSLGERLKCNTRHCVTSTGRSESVAEHCFRLAYFAWLLEDEFPQADMNRVIRMGLLHDLGEAITGDIPSFEKTKEDGDREDRLVEERILTRVGGTKGEEMAGLFREMQECSTAEAQIFHALDKMEAVISHNEAPIASWLPLEYELQKTHGQKEAAAFPYLKQLRDYVNDMVDEKIRTEGSAGK